MKLSERHRQVLQWLARGLSQKEIAHELGISRQTVRNHLVRIYDLLGLERRSAVAAVVEALRRGEITLEEVNCGSRYKKMPDDD